MDVLADIFRYSLTFLLAADIVSCAAVALCAGWYGTGRKPVLIFAAAAALVPWAVLATLNYGLALDPAQTPVYHIVNLVMNVGFVLWAWFGLRSVRPGK